MKTLNKLLLCLSLCSLLMFTSCSNLCKPIERPEDLKPIDWEGYNDVRTIYWNCTDYCSSNNSLDGRIVKLCGWKVWDRDELCDDSIFVNESSNLNSYKPELRIIVHGLSEKSVNFDLNQKCYVTGRIELPCQYEVGLFGNDCSRNIVTVFVDSVYFEK